MRAEKGVVTIAVKFRYHAKTDTYYIQVQGTKYAELNAKMKHITTHLKYIQDEEHTEERLRLEEFRRRLLQEKRQSQYYIMVPASDIPENAHIRPVYDLKGQVITVGPERYMELLDGFQGAKNRNDGN